MAAPTILGLRLRIAGHGHLTAVCHNLQGGKAVPLQYILNFLLFMISEKIVITVI